MPKATAVCNSIINLMYRAVAWANMADNAASSPVTNVTVALHTASLTAATFTMFALIAIVWGAAHLVVGVKVRQRRHWSRFGAISLASVDLLLLPYGTALGVYGLWVLLHEEAKRQFEPPVA